MMDNFTLSVQRFDEFASEYARRFMDIGPYPNLADVFCELVPAPDARILELACGPGNYTRHIRQQLPESHYLATDLAPGMLELARKNTVGVDFRLLDMRQLLILEGTFDAIFCSFGLPFLSTAGALQLIADSSKKISPGGVLYLSTMEGDESEAGFEPTSFSGKAEVFFNYHREEDLKNALESNGFSLHTFIKQEYTDPDGSVLMDMIFIGVKR